MHKFIDPRAKSEARILNPENHPPEVQNFLNTAEQSLEIERV
jgi:hypothetical protein